MNYIVKDKLILIRLNFAYIISITTYVSFAINLLCVIIGTFFDSTYDFFISYLISFDAHKRNLF